MMNDRITAGRGKVAAVMAVVTVAVKKVGRAVRTEFSPTRGPAGHNVLSARRKRLETGQWDREGGRSSGGRVLFFVIALYKVPFFGRILCRRRCIAWNTGRSVAGGVLAGRFRGRFVGQGCAESAGERKRAGLGVKFDAK